MIGSVYKVWMKNGQIIAGEGDLGWWGNRDDPKAICVHLEAAPEVDWEKEAGHWFPVEGAKQMLLKAARLRTIFAAQNGWPEARQWLRAAFGDLPWDATADPEKYKL